MFQEAKQRSNETHKACRNDAAASLSSTHLNTMTDLTLNDMTDIPIQQRLELHAERHKALWTETENLEHAHDALAQCKDELEKAKAELKKRQNTQRRWDFKL